MRQIPILGRQSFSPWEKRHEGHVSGIPGSLCSGFLTRPFQGLPYRRTMMDADSVAHPATDHDLCRRHLHRF